MDATRAVPICLALALAGCGGVELQSTRLDREITIDGDVSDWGGHIQPLEDRGVAVGLLNDDEHLYLCFTSTDRSLQARIVTGGLTLWVDADGGNDRSLGVRYPIGVFMGNSAGSFGAGERDSEHFERLVRQSSLDLEIVDEDDEILEHFVLAEASPIEGKVAIVSSVLVYEMKLPLRSPGASFDFGASPGSRIGLGFTTPKAPQEALQSLPGGPLPGGPGGSPGGGRTPAGMRRPPNVEPLDVWAKVQLAG